MSVPFEIDNPDEPLTPEEVLMACTNVRALDRTAEGREAAKNAFDEAGCEIANDIFILPDDIINVCIEALDEVTKQRFRNVVTFYRDTEEECIGRDIERLVHASKARKKALQRPVPPQDMMPSPSGRPSRILVPQGATSAVGRPPATRLGMTTLPTRSSAHVPRSLFDATTPLPGARGGEAKTEQRYNPRHESLQGGPDAGTLPTCFVQHGDDEELFDLSGDGEMGTYLGMDMARTDSGDVVISSEAYIKRTVTELEEHQGEEFREYDCPTRGDSDHPELDDSALLDPAGKLEYQKLVGIQSYLSCATRPDITLTVSSLGDSQLRGPLEVAHGPARPIHVSLARGLQEPP